MPAVPGPQSTVATRPLIRNAIAKPHAPIPARVWGVIRPREPPTGLGQVSQ
jgi:hypothetical protein